NSSKVGFSLEFNDREDGGIGLKNLYHLNLNIKTMEPALKYQAISNGDVNIIDVFSTDSKIITNKLKLLNDDRRLFPPYQGAPILREETLKKHPELEKILNKLAGKITEKEMTEMNYKVDVDGKSAYDVAKEYLQKEGLIKK
ncbi:glycine betaine ABC transporter substrate-binding protein, partial [uncultured Gemella sp.]|uniref:glycine betaine ABC transporter substrate-binding protein n=1 Tax=uncultured Gemella sp. TaxID=254352 RepID=UPI0028D24663